MISKKTYYEAKNLKKNQIVLDIETTGLDPSNDSLVLLGLVCFEADKVYVEQFFAENDLEEKRLLEIFLRKIEGKEIITYNGNTFDLPFLSTRLEKNRLASNLFFDSIDLYKIIRQKRNFFDFSSMKLVDIEKLIDINRNDPSRYKVISKLKDPNEKRENPKAIMVHNFNDLVATEKLINVENLMKNKLSLSYKDMKIYLMDIFINNDMAFVKLETSKNIHNSFFVAKDYQISSRENQIEICFNVLYGKIDQNTYGYVTKNIYNLENTSSYKVNPNFLIIKENYIYKYKNILKHCLEIIKENLSL
jgi:predicted PolB exonuclease-like 3'-5' exonuclease